MTVASSGGGVLGTIVVLAILAIWLAVKVNGYRSARCRHCAHDSGISGVQAPVYPACRRGKAIIKSRRARKR